MQTTLMLSLRRACMTGMGSSVQIWYVKGCRLPHHGPCCALKSHCVVEMWHFVQHAAIVQLVAEGRRMPAGNSKHAVHGLKPFKKAADRCGVCMDRLCSVLASR